MKAFLRPRTPVQTPLRWWACALAGLTYGLLTALSFPPVGVWPLAFVAIIPLLWAGCRAGPRVWVAGLWAGLGTLPLWMFESVWLVNVTREGYPGIGIYLSIYPGLFVWMIGTARRADWPLPMGLIAPIAWTALEVLRGEVVLTGYAWYLAGHPLIESPMLSAPAAVFGAYLVSFLCAALAGCVADAAGWSGLHRPIGGAGALVWSAAWVICWWIGSPRPVGTTAQPMRIAVVQTDLPQDNKMGWSVADRVKDFARFGELTRLAAALQPAPDLIVWPETMFPGDGLNPSTVRAQRELGLSYAVSASSSDRLMATYFHDELVKLQREVGVPMLVGAIAIDGDYAEYMKRSIAERQKSPAGRASLDGMIRRYNSALFIHKGEVREERYDKVELTPFGEMIPYVWRWPALQQMVLNLGAAGMSFDLSIGSRERGMDVPSPNRGRLAVTRVATPICFEATKADLCRRLIRGDGTGRADLLVNLSNDGWFSFWDAGRAQHMQAARWRCVEMGVPMVRAVNTGYSSAIDRRGRVITDRLIDRPADAVRQDGVLVAEVSVDSARAPTIFERVGMSAAYSVVGAGVLLTAATWVRRRRSGLGGG